MPRALNKLYICVSNIWPHRTSLFRRLASIGEMASTDIVPATPADDTQSLFGDADLVTADEVTSNHCCTCRKAVDPDNSLVIVRATEKQAEARRCRSCHNVRSAIQRLSKRHGNLVKEFSSITGERVQEFFQNSGSLRGEDLRMKIEETVTDWKTATTSYKFTQDADYLDEVQLKEKYADRPNLAENVLLNGRRFFCPVKKIMMYADPKYNAKIEDSEEHGTSTKRKAQTALKEDEDPNPKQESKSSKRKKGNGKGKNVEEASGSGEDPKLAAGQKKKLQKKMDGAIAKGALLKDAVEKALQLGNMIPTYVIDAAKDCQPVDGFKHVQDCMNAGKGVFDNLMTSLDEAVEKMSGATARLKIQLDAAEEFNK